VSEEIKALSDCESADEGDVVRWSGEWTLNEIEFTVRLGDIELSN